MRRFGSTIKVLLIGGCLLLSPGLAGAHGDEVLQHMQGAHGGQLRAVGLYHMELVVRNGELQVWMTDHGNQPQSTAGAEGTATVVGPGGRILVKLSPTGEHGLAGKDARIQPSQDLRVIVTVAMKGQQPVQARFMPGARTSSVAHHHHPG
ncbi:MAG: hypothetical protein ACOY5C_06525 [Pseudomonadota bacterium]|uniref:hypothetical protein n=1 Tax=Thermithiobacillus tepidarius TaxID=929 RepID=UPI0004101912|nr:hypothetical protein [Thermithiobacillus tepidarius]